MNETMREGKQRYQDLQSNGEFREYIYRQEQAVLKAYGRPMDEETRYALAVMWKPRSGSHDL